MIIPYLPDIALAIAGRVTDANNRQGWLYLEKFFRFWLDGKAARMDEIKKNNKQPDIYQNDFWD